MNESSKAGNALCWHDEAVVTGIQVRAFFFDPRTVDEENDFVARNLPVFKTARPIVLAIETDKKNYVFGQLIGQPDAVLAHGNGLISVEYKSESGRRHDRARWRSQLRLKAALQCIGGAMAVAGNTGKPTAAMLRCHNVLYQLNPCQEVLDYLLASVPAAKAYNSETRRVSISQLAAYCHDRIHRNFHRETDDEKKSSAAGQQRHQEMLRATAARPAPEANAGIDRTHIGAALLGGAAAAGLAAFAMNDDFPSSVVGIDEEKSIGPLFNIDGTPMMGDSGIDMHGNLFGVTHDGSMGMSGVSDDWT